MPAMDICVFKSRFVARKATSRHKRRPDIRPANRLQERPRMIFPDLMPDKGAIRG